MSRETTRARAETLLAPHREPGEELLGASIAWVATVGARGTVFFVGRHRRLLVLTDRRLLAWRKPRRGGAPGLAASIAALRLEAEHPTKPFVQLLAASGDSTVVIELRHRDRAFARAVTRVLGGMDVEARATPGGAPDGTASAAPGTD
jgi:hypothetical protein